LELRLESALVRSLQQHFTASLDECANALDCIGPIHLHGQLGFLQGFSDKRDQFVAYGGAGLTDEECAIAARNIKIVSEPKPNDEAFARARQAISAADRVVFLGFGYARQNVERLRLADCMKLETQVYLCEYGFTAEQDSKLIRPYFSAWRDLRTGTVAEDILAIFRKFPELLL
jgi:hypothetical protein